MKTNVKTKFLAEHNLVAVPQASTNTPAAKNMVSTVFVNIMYYGYIPSESLYRALSALDQASLVAFWTELKPVLENLTGADKKMDQHIVYKNFPQEVLDMSDAEYWTKQILMYLGLPNELFTQEESPRDPLLETIQFKVLQAATSGSLQSLFNQLLGSSAKWTRAQQKTILDLLATGDVSLDLTKIPFKENLVFAAVEAVKLNAPLTTRSATDVLRFAVALSDGDFSLKENSKFKSFPRSTRRFLLNLLENASNLEEDMARDIGRWKKLMVALRPGDYAKAYPKVCAANDLLYKDSVKSFAASVEALIATKDDKVLKLLETRPGEFARRLQALVQLFGRKAVNSFKRAAPKLKVIQLLKLRRYFETVQNRRFRTIAPKGNWNKLKIMPNPVNAKPMLFKGIVNAIDAAIATKVASKVPSVNLDPRVANVTLQGNDSDLTPYGRNTKFKIPDNVNFVRVASYWKTPGGFNVWYDNGLNCFDENWENKGTCCWNSKPNGGLQFAVFSGDPTSSKTIEGDACQMIDLYLDKAALAGVRYVVWNILCYSNKKFDEAEAVFASMQWGEKPQAGKPFEPSRAQLSFPVTGKNLTKYIAIIDVVEREVIYVDANLKGVVSSAASNVKTLSETMPAFMEYLETQPTIADLFKDVPKSKTGIPVLYDDEGVAIPQDGKAYVFKPLNEDNKFTQLDVSELLNL